MLEIFAAVTAEDLYECFKLRKYLFVDKYHYLTCNEKILCDEFDSLPNSVVFIAKMDNKIMGTVRFSFCTDKACNPAEKLFCFDSVINGKTYVAGSMLCAKRGIHFSHISEILLVYLYAYAYCSSAECIIACVNPAVSELFKHLGASEAGPAFTLNEYPQPILPVFSNKPDFGKIIEPFKHCIDGSFMQKKFQVYSEKEIQESHASHSKLSPIAFRKKLQVIRNKLQKENFVDEEKIAFDNLYVSIA